MTMLATDPVILKQTKINSDGSKTNICLNKRGWAATKVCSGLLRDNDNHAALNKAQIATLAVARADAALLLLGSDPDDPYEENLLTLDEKMLINQMAGYQGDDLDLTALLAIPTAPTANLAGIGAGNVASIAVPIAPTGALAATPIAGNVNLMTVPTAPTAALAGAGAGNVDHCTVPTAPTSVEGAAGLVDIGDQWYATTFVTADGETSMGAIQAAATVIALATKHITVTVPTGGANVLSRNVYRSKVGGGHVARTDFFLVGSIADNVTATFDDNLAEAGMPATNPPASNTAYKYKYVATYVALDGTETSMGAVQAAGVASTDKTADGQVTVTIPVSAEAGGGQRKIYRCAGGLAASATLRTHFFLVGTVADNSTGTFTDNVSEAVRATGANPPAANGTGGRKYIVTYTTADGETLMGAISAAITVADPTVNGQIELVIPVSTHAKVTGRKIYRSKAGVAATLRTHFLLLATIANNSATTYTDNTADGGLGAAAPAANTAAGYGYKVTFVNPAGETLPSLVSTKVTVADSTANGKIALTVIPTGPAGTTARKLYRTKGGDSAGNTFLLATISDNTTVIYTDNIADASLGAAPPSTDSATGYAIAQASYSIAQAIQTKRASATGKYVKGTAATVDGTTGAVTFNAMTIGEWMDSEIGDGYLSDSVNKGAKSDSDLANWYYDMTTALLAAL